MGRPLNLESAGFWAAWGSGLLGLSAVLGLIGGLERSPDGLMSNWWIRGCIAVAILGSIALLLSLGLYIFHHVQATRSNGGEATGRRGAASTGSAGVELTIPSEWPDAHVASDYVWQVPAQLVQDFGSVPVGATVLFTKLMVRALGCPKLTGCTVSVVAVDPLLLTAQVPLPLALTWVGTDEQVEATVTSNPRGVLVDQVFLALHRTELALSSRFAGSGSDAVTVTLEVDADQLPEPQTYWCRLESDRDVKSGAVNHRAPKRVVEISRSPLHPGPPSEIADP